MKASKYFLGALGAATTTGMVVGIGAGVIGLIGGGLIGGAVFGAACGFGAGVAVLGAATVLFPVVKLCSYIDEKTNFFTRAGEFISTPFEKFGNWVKGKFTSSTNNPSPTRQTDSEMQSNQPIFDFNASPSAPPNPRLSYTLGSESPPPQYKDLPEHKKRNTDIKIE